MNRCDETRKRLFSIAQSQSGYFTASQALEAGYSWRVQHYHTHRGHWARIDRGIYRLVEFPPGRHEDLVRWSLWSGGKAVVSHESAAAFHELGDILPARVYLTVDLPFRRKVPPEVVLHRAHLAPGEILEAEGFRVTTPPRTIMDLVTSATEGDWLASVIADALKRGAAQKEDLESRFGLLGERDRERAFRALKAVEQRPLEV